jgi:hypothetical protein
MKDNVEWMTWGAYAKWVFLVFACDLEIKINEVIKDYITTLVIIYKTSSRTRLCGFERHEQDATYNAK